MYLANSTLFFSFSKFRATKCLSEIKMPNLISFLELNCTPSVLAIDLKLVAMSVGQLQNPGSKDQIWYLVRHLAAKGRKYSEKKASTVW